MFEVIDVLIEGEVASEAQVKQMPGAIKLLLSSDEIGQGIVLNVRASKDMSTTGMKLNDEVFMNMAYAQSEGEMNVELRESTLEVPSEITFSMNQNEPNPWMNLTNIYFTSPTSEKGDFRIMDTNGKVILNKVIDCTKGENNIVVYNNELPASGIYYYELSIGSVRQMKKMILIK
jgi:hypothetical protein